MLHDSLCFGRSKTLITLYVGDRSRLLWTFHERYLFCNEENQSDPYFESRIVLHLMRARQVISSRWRRERDQAKVCNSPIVPAEDPRDTLW